MQQVDSMSPEERRASISLALVFAFRMLGLFMVLPVLAVYGQQLAGATPLLIGLAIGAYGLTQACLQIPFGMLSDRIGRKPVIVFGLLLFAAGGLLAADADSIQQVVAGRVLQGAGAIAAAVMALVADSTREQHRTKAMAMIGMSIGLAFAVAMVVGPAVARVAGLSGVFLLTSVLALVGIVLVLLAVPTPQQAQHHRDAGIVRGALWPALSHPELLRLNYGIACLHAILMATFLAVPLALQQQAGLPKEEHWWVYFAALLLSFCAMLPFIIYAERQRQMRRVVLAAVALLALVQPLLWLAQGDLPWLVAAVVLFFVAFNLLEATLPSLLSKIAPAGGKGTAMGVYSTSQFAGAALGGVMGGWLLGHFGLSGVFIGCAVLALSWLVIGVTMREPPYVTSQSLLLSPAQAADPRLSDLLLAVPGVTDVVVVVEETTAYLKVDSKLLDREALSRVVVPV